MAMLIGGVAIAMPKRKAVAKLAEGIAFIVESRQADLSILLLLLFPKLILLLLLIL